KVDHPALTSIRRALNQAVGALSEATQWVLENYGKDVRAAAAGAVPYLMLWGTVLGGYQLAKSALIAKQALDRGSGEADFYRGKIATARFFAEHHLPQAQAYRSAIVQGAASVMALETQQL
ncbi:MAG: acyl-CoA dehydrogenase, partial [Betaproteobacteria bacterium]|nr:acyl-CoA dehydrogenase [Betaproteobacteria bacterium]